MKLIRNAIVAGMAVAAISAAACSSQQQGPTGTAGNSAGNGTPGYLDEGTTGSVSMHLTIPGTSIQLTSLTYTINGGTSPIGPVTVTIGDAQSLEFVAGGIPAGGPYTVTINGTDSNGDVCLGTSAPFTIIAGEVTQTTLTVTCTAPGGEGSITSAVVDGGSVEVDASVVYAIGDAGQSIACPGISSFSISPAEINLSQSAQLSLLTVGPTPTITWSAVPATGGSFSSPNAQNPTFTCSGSAAQVAITATVALPGTTACSGEPFTVFPATGTGPALINCEIGAVDSGTTPVDSGTTPVDSGTTPVDSGTTPVDSGTTPVDSGTTVAACVGGVNNVCPASNTTVCTLGETDGIGGSTCNQTEAAIFNSDHTGACLDCMLNASCLHDTEGDNPSTGVYDCDDLTGTTASTSVAGCIGLLGCEISTECGVSNLAYCYCGNNVGSTACEAAGFTLPTNECVTQEQAAIGSTSTPFILSNLTTLTPLTAGGVANTISNCAKNRCGSVCNF